MAQTQGNDRREFFRINDRVIVDFRPIEQEQATVIGQRLQSPTSQQDNQQLRTLESAFTHLVDQINHQDRDIARALRMLDDKLNLIHRQIRNLVQPVETEKARDVNLSGGGMALISDQSLPAKTQLEVSIQLIPSAITITAVARVISCKPIDDGYHLRMAFVHMDEYDRNLLVKHTLSRQAEQLRAERADEV